MQSSPIHLHWREYEQLVSEIFPRLLKEEHELCFGDCNRWEGKSGYKHQIDVSLRLHDRIELMECKCWSKNVSAAQFLLFWARVHDIQPMYPGVKVGGTMIANLGFQPGAETLAKYYKTVDLQIVYDQGREYDWGPLSAILMERLGE